MYGYEQNAYGAPPPPPGYGAPPHGVPHQYGGSPPHTAPPPGGQPPPGAQAPPPPQHYPEPSPPSLADAVRGFATGALSPEEFQGIFHGARVYCPRGETPGFLALHNTQQPVIPMFTSLKELRSYAGKESRYFVITGAEVLDLLPTGYGFVLDMEGDHRVVFDAKAVEEMVDFAMQRMYY
ncbi:SseB family protein [Streptomyces sp. JJ38]|uniref:SseB family protein n=1 Tax=Streptomyces sp. JJ38 TaxID=2738128 RepID=UPI001C573B65|nr:SseB family protein [Streptomyces sp. JJ38]MBW1596356.1 SseB family protein [Streptomyces sp. JJ38]